MYKAVNVQGTDGSFYLLYIRRDTNVGSHTCGCPLTFGTDSGVLHNAYIINVKITRKMEESEHCVNLILMSFLVPWRRYLERSTVTLDCIVCNRLLVSE